MTCSHFAQTVIIILTLFIKQNLADDWIIDTNRMLDKLAFPVLSNGHLGFSVFDTSVYLNGVYNGRMNKSHRARIDNHANLQAEICNTDKKPDSNCNYRFNIKRGTFETLYTGMEYALTHEVFPHRYYTHTIVNKFVLTRQHSVGEITLKVNENPGQINLDISFPGYEYLSVKQYNFTCETGNTAFVENDSFQKKPTSVSVCFSPLPQLVLPPKVRVKTFYSFMVVGTDQYDVRSEAEKIVFDGEITEKHVDEWQTFWDNFDIEIDNRAGLSKKVRSSIYYLASNFPSMNSFHTSNKFYGVSSSGLGRVDSQTKGRITWDQEMFMFMPVLFMNPYWSEQILDYRSRVKALDPLTNGSNYFWEMGYTGQHLDIYKEMIQATHVPADVAFATRLQLSATHDLTWFRQWGCDLAYNTAKYWVHRAQYNRTTDLYDLSGVRAPSSKDDPLTNNAFVNIAAGYNLYLGEFARCVCKNKYDFDLKFKQFDFNEIALSLTLPLDDKEEYVKAHEDYEEYIHTSAADALLINYPLQYPLPDKIKQNTLNHYRKLKFENSPPTTWAIHLISDLERNDTLGSQALFYQITSSYLIAPFNIWTDTTEQNQHTIYNFVSGAGALLQVLMNGYGGIRLHFDRLEIKMPQLPPETTSMTIKGFYYLSARYSLKLEETGFTLTLLDTSKDGIKVVAYLDGKKVSLEKSGDKVRGSPKSTLVIKEAYYPYEKCTMPKNVIGVRKTDQAMFNRIKAEPNSTLVILSCVFIVFMSVLAVFMYIYYRRNGAVLPGSSIRYVRKM